MSAPLVTLTTDFGIGSSYVAAMKGALWARAPLARLTDLSHAIPPQDVQAAARFLVETVPWFPAGTLHVVVVDPGVGSERAILCVELLRQRLLVPDNGCWVPLAEAAGVTPRAVAVTVSRFWHQDVAPTFHGRDIFAPVAAALANGLPAAELGPQVTSWVQLRLPRPIVGGGAVRGEVVTVDRFGNLITNISRADLDAAGLTTFDVLAGTTKVPAVVTTYADEPAGELVALMSSAQTLEVAVVNGSAAARLGLGVGAAVEAGPPLAGLTHAGKKG